MLQKLQIQVHTFQTINILPVENVNHSKMIA